MMPSDEELDYWIGSNSSKKAIARAAYLAGQASAEPVAWFDNAGKLHGRVSAEQLEALLMDGMCQLNEGTHPTTERPDHRDISSDCKTPYWHGHEYRWAGKTIADENSLLGHLISRAIEGKEIDEFLKTVFERRAAACKAAERSDHREVMRMALEALEYHEYQTRPIERTSIAIEILRNALGEQG